MCMLEVSCVPSLPAKTLPKYRLLDLRKYIYPEMSSSWTIEGLLYKI